jgi:hypothetical protein
MPTYKQLKQRNPCVDHERNEELRALYEGGQRLERKIRKFIPKRGHEPQQRYEARLGEAEYRNYTGPIIDFFASMLFASKPTCKAKRNGEVVENPGDYWLALQEDCTRGGVELDAFFKDVLIDAMQTKTGWIRLHAPESAAIEYADIKAFEDAKAGECWVEDTEDYGVLDWEIGPDGRLLWACTHRKESRRMSPDGGRDTVTETWEWLTPEDVTVYQLKWDLKNPPADDTEVPRVGAPVPHRFGAVPLVCLDLPPGLWVAERLRSPQLAHLRKQSALNWSLATTAYAMPVAFVKDPDNFKQAVMGAGYELVLGVDDKWEWEAPPTAHYAALDSEIKATKDEIFRIAHQMALGVDNNAAAVGRTAESKASDMESTRVVLAAFSRIVRETIEYTFDTIATARGETDLEWVVEGLDDFAALDVDKFINQLALVKDKLGAIPSRTFAVESNKRMAHSILVDLDEDVAADIDKEIERDTTDPAEDAQAERDAFLLATKGSASGKRPSESAAAPATGPAKNPNSGSPKGGQKLAGGKAAP